MSRKISYSKYIKNKLNGKRTIDHYKNYHLVEILNNNTTQRNSYYLIEKIYIESELTAMDNFYKLTLNEFTFLEYILDCGTLSEIEFMIELIINRATTK